MPRLVWIAAAVLCCLGCLFAMAPGERGAMASGIDLRGQPVSPIGDGITVLVFVDRDCPISNRYLPTSANGWNKPWPPRRRQFSSIRDGLKKSCSVAQRATFDLAPSFIPGDSARTAAKKSKLMGKQ